jgi:glycogen synthase kinase 3 beta
MDYLPENAYQVLKYYLKHSKEMPPLLIKLYAYQMFRALVYIGYLGICHRDIKPQNILVDRDTQRLMLCDFGSAKKFVKGESNVSYISSRYYRAPELIFGESKYSTMIDVWSTGCVIGELMLGKPLFPGENGADQLVQIVKILGTPNKEQIIAMNPRYNEYKFPVVKQTPWNKVFKAKTDPQAIDFISKVLIYEPKKRLKPIEALLHPWFDELRDKRTKLPNGNKLPDLFNFCKGSFLSLIHRGDSTTKG